MKSFYTDIKFHNFFPVFHPFDGFYEVKYKNKGSIYLTFIVLAVWFFASIFQRQNTGYVINHNDLEQLNLYIIFVKTIGLFLLWVVCNWAVATFLNGIGYFKEVWLVSAYAVMPYIVMMIITTFFSNYMTIEETAFLQYFMIVGVIWSSVIMLIGMMTIHNYEFLQTIGSLILTVVFMGIFIFLTVLLYTLIIQLITFLYTLFNEFLFRI